LEVSSFPLTVVGEILFDVIGRVVVEVVVEIVGKAVLEVGKVGVEVDEAVLVIAGKIVETTGDAVGCSAAEGGAAEGAAEGAAGGGAAVALV
jgi:hypothetical protein